MIETDFANERELETALIAVAREAVGPESVVMRGFGLDIAVFLRERGGPALRLIEVKAFSPHHGRCGFGHGKGGNQVRLLWDETLDTPRPAGSLDVLDHSIRWVIGHRGRSIGDPRYAFLTCTEVQNAASGGVRAGKYNNIRLTELNWWNWSELEQRMKTFLSAERAL
jgi:hypothetical protein